MIAPDELVRPATWPDRPLVMGIVNVTPDSFSDGGEYFRWEKAVEHGLRLVSEGADLLDVGGESTRPGSSPVPEEEELSRVLPVLRALAGETRAALSVDTRKRAVAREALQAGATWINDVGGLEDQDLIRLAVEAKAGVCCVHMQGQPSTMQDRPHYEDAVTEVSEFLRARARSAEAAGLDRSRIWVDPGIGFGKTLDHNLSLMAALDRIAALGYPVVLGASRKGFIGEISRAPVDRRLGGSLAAAGQALAIRPSIVRVHDVHATRQYFLVRQRLDAARQVID